MKKTATLTLGSLTAFAAINNADAAIVYFDINPDQTLSVGNSVNFGNINVITETYTLGSNSGAYFGLDLYENGFRYAIFIGTANGSIQWGAAGEADGPKLSENTSISGTSPWSWISYGPSLAVDNVNYWGSGGTGYAALRIDLGSGNYNYGWAEITYSPNGASTTAMISGFAFEGTPNTAILAGDTGSAAVPEPGQVAASVLLLTGIAGYLAYRRRMGAATEPDALHKLALGSRGIADFRADKAA